MQQKKKMSVVAALLMAGIILVLMIAVSIGFFGVQIQKISKTDESLYFDHLYTISADLINADRDFYQSMLGAIQYHDIAMAPADIPPEMLQELLDQYYDDYVSNKEQVLERVNEAHEIASKEPSLNTGTVIDVNNFDTLYNTFMENYNTWESSYDVKTGEGDYTLYIQNFETARDSLSEMTDILEVWAVNEKAAHAKQVQLRILISIVVFTIITVIILIVALTILMSMRKSVKYMVGAVNNMASGDFASLIRTESAFGEFYNVEYSLEDMRKRLKSSLLDVVS
ncbi:MAG: hypothetical protein J6Z07_03045, partial [Lachnospiraceae bacterium]|nr:hypothetical protein [Lachnospiraceae bacterium]